MLSAFDGGRLFGIRTGEKPHVLALHGWRGDSSQMAGVIEGMDAISLDLPGHGASPEPNAVWGAAEYATAVMPVLESMERPRIIVGYSFGGRIAVHLASAIPDEVDGVVLTGVPLLRTTNKRKASLGFRVLKRAHAAGIISDARMEAERERRGSPDYRAARGLMRDVFVKLVNESYEEQLRHLRCPVEMVWGDRDTEAPLPMARRAAELVPQANLSVVAGGTHWFLANDPTPVREAIERCSA